MKDLCRTLVFLFIPILLPYVQGADEELKKSINSLIQVYRHDDRSFIYNLRGLIPSILEVSRAELHVRRGTLNVSSDILEDFKTLERELARYPPSFLHLIDKVKLPGNVISFRECIKTVNEIMAKRRKFLEANEDRVDETASEFSRAFVDKLILASDVLYESLYNKFHPEKQLFEQFAMMSYQHPIQTMTFMHGCFEILTQLMMLEVNHVEMTLTGEDGIVAFETEAKRRMNRIMDLALKIDTRHYTPAEIFKQIEKDQRRFHEQWQSLSHCDFATQAKAYFEGKYPPNHFFVTSYEPVRSFDNHAYITCTRDYAVFSYFSRNSLIFHFPQFLNKENENYLTLAKSLLARVPDKIRIKKDKALEVAEAIDKRFDRSCQLSVIFVLKKSAQICYRGPV